MPPSAGFTASLHGHADPCAECRWPGGEMSITFRGTGALHHRQPGCGSRLAAVDGVDPLDVLRSLGRLAVEVHADVLVVAADQHAVARSEEHTSDLPSLLRI